MRLLYTFLGSLAETPEAHTIYYCDHVLIVFSYVFASEIVCVFVVWVCVQEELEGHKKQIAELHTTVADFSIRYQVSRWVNPSVSLSLSLLSHSLLPLSLSLPKPPTENAHLIWKLL